MREKVSCFRRWLQCLAGGSDRVWKFMAVFILQRVQIFCCKITRFLLTNLCFTPPMIVVNVYLGAVMRNIFLTGICVFFLGVSSVQAIQKSSSSKTVKPQVYAQKYDSWYYRCVVLKISKQKQTRQCEVTQVSQVKQNKKNGQCSDPCFGSG